MTKVDLVRLDGGKACTFFFKPEYCKTQRRTPVSPVSPMDSGGGWGRVSDVTPGTLLLLNT